MPAHIEQRNPRYIRGIGPGNTCLITICSINMIKSDGSSRYKLYTCSLQNLLCTFIDTADYKCIGVFILPCVNSSGEI
jgi:hypothetical protein